MVKYLEGGNIRTIVIPWHETWRNRKVPSWNVKEYSAQDRLELQFQGIWDVQKRSECVWSKFLDRVQGIIVGMHSKFVLFIFEPKYQVTKSSR